MRIRITDLATSIIFVLTCTLVSASCPAEELEVGSQAPKFQAKDATGKTWSSDDYYGKRIVVIYFYPAAMTGGCTKQACAYRDDKQKLTEKGIEIVGVSGDEVEALQVFQKAYDLNFTLLSDPDGSVAKAFGVPLRDGGEITREVDGKKVELKRGVTASRWTFVVGKDGKIAAINKKVDAADDSQYILELFQ